MIQKNSTILVKVEEALADLIVVSYSVENKKFEGVLLDTQKGNLPFGVYNLHPAFSSSSSTNRDDKLYSVNQRFAYDEDQTANPVGQLAKKTISKVKPQQKQKMTVRLRPRKVLCSNCKGICNENNENVDLGRKRKVMSGDESETKTKSHSDKNYVMQNTLIPKLSRLQPQEISNAIKGNSKTKVTNKSGAAKASEDPVNSGENMGRVTQELTFVDVGSDTDKIMYFEGKTDDVNEKVEESFNPIYSSARTLKICYGEGEGTVVKIPATVGDYNEDSGVSFDISKPPKQIDPKSVKKALKRAKKLQKKSIIKTKLPKPAGALSPRNNSAENVTEKEIVLKKQKHKLKHKKKHKEPKNDEENVGEVSESVGYFSDIKKSSFKEKLAISLRRLSSNSYEKCDTSDSEDWDSDTVPEFPTSSNGGVGTKALRVTQGDVLWGKIVGFPWWPCRVLTVTPASQAHVLWYASTLTSLMPCDSLCSFLENYKLYFNKKKKGPYKAAVKQATVEAKKIESHLQDPLASPKSLPTMSPRPINVFS